MGKNAPILIAALVGVLAIFAINQRASATPLPATKPVKTAEPGKAAGVISAIGTAAADILNAWGRGKTPAPTATK